MAPRAVKLRGRPAKAAKKAAKLYNLAAFGLSSSILIYSSKKKPKAAKELDVFESGGRGRLPNFLFGGLRIAGWPSSAGPSRPAAQQRRTP
jgi:hypothetical protein